MTSLATQTVKKIYREIFMKKPIESPIQASIWEQERVLKNFKQKLRLIQGITLSEIQTDYRKKPYMYVSIYLHSPRLYEEKYVLAFDSQGYLELQYYTDMYVKLNDDTDIWVTYRDALKKAAKLSDDRQVVLRAEAVKRDKIRDLKKAAINAKIKEIAVAENVTYNIDDIYVSKLKLIVRFNDKRMEMDIPYKNYQDILQNLQIAIRSIKDLIDKGVSVKLK